MAKTALRALIAGHSPYLQSTSRPDAGAGGSWPPRRGLWTRVMERVGIMPAAGRGMGAHPQPRQLQAGNGDHRQCEWRRKLIITTFWASAAMLRPKTSRRPIAPRRG